MGVGALATRLLADFGAEVIKIEDRDRMDLVRRLPIYKGEPGRAFGEEDAHPDPEKSGLFNNYNRNKLGVTLNMRTKKGRELAEQLFLRSDIVSENFAAGVMERWGVTYDRLRELRPDVIYARMSGFGHSGPREEYRSYGPVVQAVSGLSYLGGLPGREPSGWGFSYMDNMAAYFNTSALLVALLERSLSGRGQEIDCSAVETGIGLVGPQLFDVTVNNRPTRRAGFPIGNRLEYPPAAPHGVYRCHGEDRWCAIAVFNDEQWAALVDALDHPEWAADPAYATAASRYENQDSLDRHLTGWTSAHDAHDVMNLLQRHEIAAAAVQNAQDLSESDPQIKAHGTFFEMNHPIIGDALFENMPAIFSGFAPDHWRSAPLLGEDNGFVFGELLGLSPAEMARLESEGVI